MQKNDTITAFKTVIRQSAEALNKKEIAMSRSLIVEAMVLDMDAPEPHNLLGILYELTGNDTAARKHYRAAYALDPTYKPACRNLERLVAFEWGSQSREFDYGFDLK